MSHLGPGKAVSSKEQTGLRYPSNGKTIYHRPLNRTKTAELSQSSFAYLFSEMVTYAQRRVTGIQELEKRYATCPNSLLHSSSSSVQPANDPTTYLASTSKATPSASNSSTSSSRENHPAPKLAPSPSLPSCTSSRSTSGPTSSAAKPTVSRRAPTRTPPTST